MQPKATPHIEFVIEVDLELVTIGPNQFEILEKRKKTPVVVATPRTKGNTEIAYRQWGSSWCWYDFEKKTWAISLGMETHLYDERGKLAGVGFNGEEHHIGTTAPIKPGYKLRYHRVGLGLYQGNPIYFYPDIVVKEIPKQ
jgi:hypothetical protein